MAAAGTPLVFIHGAQQEGFCWSALARRLARPGRPVFTPDLPGHGRDRATPLATVEALADWLLHQLDARGWAEACLIGHSLGSLIALAATARAPERVAQLALLGTAVPMPVAPRLLESAAANPARAMAAVNRGSHSVRGWLAAPSAIGLWAPGMNLRLMERQRPDCLHADLAACDAYQDGLAAAARVRCPVLVVSGSEDRMTPPAAARPLQDQLAQVRSITIPGAGHALMAEAPEALADVLAGFFDAP
jgi:pimeloyl-ACP methyl ester carboxylesterase